MFEIKTLEKLKYELPLKGWNVPPMAGVGVGAGVVGVALGRGATPPVAGPPGGVACVGAVGVPAPPVFVGPAGTGAGVGAVDGVPAPACPPICAPPPGAGAGGVGEDMGVPASASVWFRVPAPIPGTPLV
jgi:hypothetical protein